jgi:cobalamin transport system substrate-binding protein
MASRPPDVIRLVRATACAIAIVAAAGLGQPRPQRIVSLIPAVTEMLFAVGAGPQVVAVSSFDEYPSEVTQLERVGALLDPDVERILALRPDLVIVYASQTDLQAQLARAQIPVFTYKHGGLRQIFDVLDALGRRVGRQAEAEAVAGRMRTAIAAIRSKVAGKPRVRTLVVFGREARALRGIYASGGVGFIHDMLEAAGGVNVFADVARESVQATTETIIARRPDAILELRATPMPDTEIAAETAVWKALASVPAVRTNRVTFIIDQRTVVPGPRAAEGIERLARALHPQAFQ